jgi:hypothetical protein
LDDQTRPMQPDSLTPEITPELCRLALVKIRAAIAGLDVLILSDAWDALPSARQQAVTSALERMRLDSERLETILGAWRADLGL